MHKITLHGFITYVFIRIMIWKGIMIPCMIIIQIMKISLVEGYITELNGSRGRDRDKY